MAEVALIETAAGPRSRRQRRRRRRDWEGEPSSGPAAKRAALEPSAEPAPHGVSLDELRGAVEVGIALNAPDRVFCADYVVQAGLVVVDGGAGALFALDAEFNGGRLHAWLADYADPATHDVDPGGRGLRPAPRPEIAADPAQMARMARANPYNVLYDAATRLVVLLFTLPRPRPEVMAADACGGAAEVPLVVAAAAPGRDPADHAAAATLLLGGGGLLPVPCSLLVHVERPAHMDAYDDAAWPTDVTGSPACAAALAESLALQEWETLVSLGDKEGLTVARLLRPWPINEMDMCWAGVAATPPQLAALLPLAPPQLERLWRGLYPTPEALRVRGERALAPAHLRALEAAPDVELAARLQHGAPTPPEQAEQLLARWLTETRTFGVMRGLGRVPNE